MDKFMKKKNLLILWVIFIVLVNIYFVMFVALKSPAAALVFGVLSLAVLVFACICTVKRSKLLKQQRIEGSKAVKEKMDKIDDILNKQG